ncbi:SAVED domain-containing protein [Rhizobium ruizarguesonis]|uniref:SAVED domain-containing protein n=1 Tax=Rhizobium TaxID=379 RepID=UPI0010305747|nr:SAVED domain-containing protein [Rhizobium ruizarguesonis]NEH34876.1 SAVED domain-containing protein [Rhizobium ruizarguesonis]NEI78701.1 SAVED domain-containing protein [Rhizobium ruizarguesonis]TAW77293.1 SAVED domain-containing protein [Rhizobium ruizarguesonis]TAX14259.1 SAVED domain-containing protein [Rhizobium ruizarguesonis]TAX19091.1 SAVED domain-containing protein [Rhizobium ruizarguesonis]
MSGASEAVDEQLLADKSTRRRPSLPQNVKAIVWARAAGRCEFRGCNCNLIGDLLTGKDDLNRAYIAHIVSDAPKGPRGDDVLSPQLSIDPTNLMLLCDTHHRLIDGSSTWREYPDDILREMKAEHEDRIEGVTSIARDRGSHVIRFAAGIGKNESPVNTDAVKEALLPEFYPIRNGMIDLDVPDLGIPDSDPAYWPLHQRLLREKYQERVKGRLERNEINRLTVFGLAPMPLLIELGRLISDISEANVRQRVREPTTWEWQPEPGNMELVRESPASNRSVIALKLGVSGPIDDHRITAALGEDVSIWSLSAKDANNDVLRTRSDLVLWRKDLRAVFEAIKDRHGNADIIHLFPAIPVSAAIEVGRVWMPKAHLPMRIYDHNRALGGFRQTLDIVHQA